MTRPTASSVLRNRAAVAEELRRLLPKMERVSTAPSIPFRLRVIDRHLPQGGLSGGALHEVVPEAGAMPAAFGFLVALLGHVSSPPAFCSPPSCGEGMGMGVGVGRFYAAKTGAPAPIYERAQPPDPPPCPPLQGGRVKTRARPLLLVLPAYGLRDYGRPHGHGLNAFGLPPHRLILAETTHRKDTLWTMEEALHARAVAAIAGVIDQLDLKTSQRLQLAAADFGLPLFLLRPAASFWKQARRRRAGASARRRRRATASA